MLRRPFLFALCAAAAGPALAGSPSGSLAEEAVARQRAAVRALVNPRCESGRSGEEIIVCGQQEASERHRVPDGYEGSSFERPRPGGEIEILGRGNLSMSTSEVSTDRSTGAGVRVKLRF